MKSFSYLVFRHPTIKNDENLHFIILMDLTIFNKFFCICNNNCTVHWALCTRHVIGILNYLIFTVILWNSVTIPHFTYEDHIGDSVPQDVNSGHSDSKSNSALFLLLPSNYGWCVSLCILMHRLKDRLRRYEGLCLWGQHEGGETLGLKQQRFILEAEVKTRKQ